jgi:hypothetical protein
MKIFCFKKNEDFFKIVINAAGAGALIVGKVSAC